MGIKETALSLHLMYPLDYVAFSRGYSSSHRAVDIAWGDDPNMPIYAPADGTVYLVRDGRGSSSTPDYGNYVMIQHCPGVWTLSAHMLKGSVCVSKGQYVKRGQILGRMGASGYAFGAHDHFEVYLSDTYDSNRVNPVDYVFAYPNQRINKEDEKTYGIKRYTPIETVGNPVDPNPMTDQLEVITDTLRARETPGLNGKVLGYVKQGYYDVNGIKEADGYRWYQVDKFWCANDKEETWCHFHPTQYVGTPVPRNENVNQINVTATTLRARKEPGLNGEILGFVKPGIYNCTDRTEADGYKWFKVEGEWDDFWAAQSKSGGWIEFLPAKDPHYDLTMKSLNKAQLSAMESWCKAEGVEYTITEV